MHTHTHTLFAQTIRTTTSIFLFRLSLIASFSYPSFRWLFPRSNDSQMFFASSQAGGWPRWAGKCACIHTQGGIYIKPTKTDLYFLQGRRTKSYDCCEQKYHELVVCTCRRIKRFPPSHRSIPIRSPIQSLTLNSCNIFARKTKYENLLASCYPPPSSHNPELVEVAILFLCFICPLFNFVCAPPFRGWFRTGLIDRLASERVWDGQGGDCVCGMPTHHTSLLSKVPEPRERHTATALLVEKWTLPRLVLVWRLMFCCTFHTTVDDVYVCVCIRVSHSRFSVRTLNA